MYHKQLFESTTIDCPQWPTGCIEIIIVIVILIVILCSGNEYKLLRSYNVAYGMTVFPIAVLNIAALSGEGVPTICWFTASFISICLEQ